jgi:hypothetical protein
MTTRLRVFVISAQKELEDERLIVQNLVNTDSFLSVHCVPVLFELEPASPDNALESCEPNRKVIVKPRVVIVNRSGSRTKQDSRESGYI